MTKAMTEQEFFQDGSKLKMNRRDFLIALGLCTVSGKMVYDTIQKAGLDNEAQDKSDIEQMIYNEYPKYQHKAITKSVVYMTQDNKKIEFKPRPLIACGGVVDNKYITVHHCIDNVTEYLEKMADKVVTKTTLYGVELKLIHSDPILDIAIFEIPEEIQIKYKHSIKDVCFDEPKLGQDVYIVGNPALLGVNVRKGKVSDLDGVIDEDGKSNPLYFGIDKPMKGGDSSTFDYNDEGQLMGINVEAILGCVGYAIKMKAYEKWLR